MSDFLEDACYFTVLMMRTAIPPAISPTPSTRRTSCVHPVKKKVPPIAATELIKTKDEPSGAAYFFRESKLFRYIREGDCVYFVHSYYAENCDDSLIATAEYGAELTAAVARGNICGCQFHPEKSGSVGLAILEAFARM